MISLIGWFWYSFNGSNHHIASGKNSTKSKAWPTLAVDQGLYPRQVGPGCSETPEIRSWTLVKGHTVDGSEIPRSPVEVGSLSHYLPGSIYLRWCRISEPSTVSTGLISVWCLDNLGYSSKFLIHLRGPIDCVKMACLNTYDKICDNLSFEQSLENIYTEAVPTYTTLVPIRSAVLLKGNWARLESRWSRGDSGRGHVICGSCNFTREACKSCNENPHLFVMIPSWQGRLLRWACWVIRGHVWL